jgi:hypothetical protein
VISPYIWFEEYTGDLATFTKDAFEHEKKDSEVKKGVIKEQVSVRIA